MTISSEWQEWINKNSHLMTHPANYEVLFVEKILSQIPELNTYYLHAQFPFKDQDNRSRRIDFMVLDETKGICLAIEIDGLSKIQSHNNIIDYSSWGDLLKRQNALLKNVGCMLLRYSNQQWRYQSNFVINEIRNELLKQEIDFSKSMEDKIKEIDYKAYLELKLNEKTLEVSKLKEHKEKTDELLIEKNKILNFNNKLKLKLEEQKKITSMTQSLREEILHDLTLFKNKLNNMDTEQYLTTNQITNLIEGNEVSCEIEKDRITSVALGKLIGIETKEALDMLSQEKNNEIKNNIIKLLDENKEKSLKQNRIALIFSFLALFIVSVFVIYLYDNKNIVNKIEPIKNSFLFSEGKETQEIVIDEKKTYLPKVIEETISASEAYNYIDEEKIVCGKLEQIKSFNKMTFLNIDSHYPNILFNAVIWDDNAKKFMGINLKLGKPICINGIISEYNGVPRIILKEKKQLRG
ncbi:hypothetical protein GWI68_04265 [Proteus sp. G2669]|uniref:hypothetical protein n=1 Tax=Proteus sp. G2669 TaxID=2698881 RepID=UPI00141321C4|nr:hypothetical protein [Proteus sp. G2669]NBM54011.1 hypothetical protein [Proteus sp. G2669]